MISDLTMHPGPDQLFNLLRSEYLRRLARFALIDDVPAPWGIGMPAAESIGSAPIEQADD